MEKQQNAASSRNKERNAASMKTPSNHMANKGVSSYEHHMDSARPAHMGSKNSEPHSMSGGSAPGPGAHMAPTSLHNFSGGGPTHVANSSSMSGGQHDLGM